MIEIGRVGGLLSSRLNRRRRGGCSRESSRRVWIFSLMRSRWDVCGFAFWDYNMAKILREIVIFHC